MEINYKQQVLQTARELQDVNNFHALLESVEDSTKNKLTTVITQFEAVNNLNVTIFPKSFAFRVGTSSRNVISSYPTGFKGDLKDQRQFLQLITRMKSNKNDVRLTDIEFKSLVLLYFLLYQPNKIKYGEDTSLQAETATISQTVNKMRSIMSDRDFLYIEVGKEKYTVDDFKKVSGVPKADAAFYFKNQPVLFCSLKNGGSPGNFQQYGGWPVDLSIKSREDVRREPTLEKFVSRVENIFKGLGLKPSIDGKFDFNNLKKGTNFAEYLDDANLAYKVIYGKDYGSTNYGINNVQILLDGDIIFKPSNSYFTLEGSFHTDLNPKIAKRTQTFKIDPNSIYAPVMLLAKSESQGLNQAGFKNVRAYVFPNNKVAKTYMEKTKRIEEILKRGNKDEVARLKQEITK